jgi:single-stranded-DNA-specific exonuclease
LNIKRQQLTRDVTAGALAQIERDPSLLTDYHALVLSHEQWPGGIVGIVAGKLAERFHKPAVLISAPKKKGELARGSGRSVPGADLVAALNACAGLLGGHGGHPGAAGFSIDPARIDQFRDAFSRAIAQAADTIPEPVLEIDDYVELPELTMDLVQEISRLAPFGPGNPLLTLAVRDLKLASQAAIGRTGEHLRLTVEDSQDNTQTVFWWQGADQPLPTGVFDLALTIRASDYRGMAEVQVEWIEARPHQPEVIEVEAAPPFGTRDSREERDPGALLAELVEEGEVQVWAEGLKPPTGVEARTRLQLEPCPQLIVWTAPPGPREWQEALDRAQPDQVIVFARETGTDERRVFLHALGILGDRAIEDLGGVFPLQRAAARLGHRVGTVCAGLDYLEASGTLSIVERGKDAWLIQKGTDEPDTPLVERTRAKLDEYLYETAAYRGSFRKAPVESLARQATLQKQV